MRSYNGHQIACAVTTTHQQCIVIFCHGFRGNSTGPNRLFVTVARSLAAQGIDSLRFDQYGSGNSAGEFIDSSFNDWVATTTAIVNDYLQKGYKVALLGQSMGGATVITVASQLPTISAVAAWAPDPNIEEFVAPASGVLEEAGQRIGAAYWQEAHDMQVADKLKLVQSPAYIAQCDNDEYVSAANHQALINNAQPQHTLDMWSGYTHSSWSWEQAEPVVDKTVEFLVRSFQVKE